VTPVAAWTAEAESDLESIVSYIVQDGRPRAARQLAEDIRARAEHYTHQPLMGTARPDIDEMVRIFSHKSFVVLYEPRPDGIVKLDY
jgi:plasmid stabilization system protein ParE